MISKTRSVLDIDRSKGTVTKRYRDPHLAAGEIFWYQALDFGHPRLLDADPEQGILVTEYHPPATALPNYRPINELIALLKELQRIRVHHRDVWEGNIVAGPDGPLLIDLETVTQHIGSGLSYDLYGPVISGVPVPGIHQALGTGYCMSLCSDHRMSLKNRWNIDISALL